MRSWILNNVLNVEYKLNINRIVEHINTKLHIKLNELNIATFCLPYSFEQLFYRRKSLGAPEPNSKLWVKRRFRYFARAFVEN